MIDNDCSACEQLRQDAPNFVVNGMGDTEVASLKNNTGLNPSSGNDDCEDLNNMNDCLVKNMETEIDSYNVCSWKDYMKALVGNLWTMFKGVISAICGLWTKVDKHECELDHMYDGATFEIGEEPSDGSYVVAGKGVSFYEVSGGETPSASDIHLVYIAGGLFFGHGSLILHQTDFTDAKACPNFDNGSVERTSQSRKGNPLFGSSGRYANDGELFYEIRLKKSQYPQISRFFNGFGIETGAGSYTVRSIVFNEGSYAFGNHGGCNVTTGERNTQETDDGHLVPAGYIYIQLRLSHTDYEFPDGNKRSPMYYMGGRMNREQIEC